MHLQEQTSKLMMGVDSESNLDIVVVTRLVTNNIKIRVFEFLLPQIVRRVTAKHLNNENKASTNIKTTHCLKKWKCCCNWLIWRKMHQQ